MGGNHSKTAPVVTGLRLHKYLMKRDPKADAFT